MVRDRLNEKNNGGGGYSDTQEMQEYRNRPQQLRNDGGYSGRPSGDYNRNQEYGRPSGDYRRQNEYNNNSSNSGYNNRAGDSRGDYGGIGSDSEVFFGKIDQINSDLDRVDRNVQQIGGLHTRLLNAVSRDETNRYQTELDRLQDECSRLLGRSRDSIKKLTGETKKMPNQNDGEVRIRKSKQSTTAQRLMKITQEFQDIQMDSKKKYRQRMEREIRIARPDATREEIERALDSNSGPVFAQELLSSRVQSQKQTLREVQDRHVELRKIEESILELFELFQEMQMLIDAQQETINNIEIKVEDTEVQLTEASKEMTKAIEYRKASRKKAWIISGIVLVLIIIGLILLYFYVIKPILDASNAGKNNGGTGNVATAAVPTATGAVPTATLRKLLI
ncbi:Plasma membrane t-SNARE, secretory vesicle fusion [Nowakowskiella sp. JEL0407]|nr:Plasma membrane t-SNARE, secretory vesicle fusion [Nowakowskiella sp. JEL0407]